MDVVARIAETFVKSQKPTATIAQFDVLLDCARITGLAGYSDAIVWRHLKCLSIESAGRIYLQ